MSSTPAPTTTDERAPLLPPPAPTTQGIPPPVPTAQGIPTPGEEGLDPEDPLVQSGQLPVTPVKRKLTAWTIFWYIILAAVTVVLVVLFVKGIRDADHVDFDLKKALKTALGGGLSGAAAMVLQVLTLMPIRTVMNYQYRYGTGTLEATRHLYSEGGYARYYAGLGAALFQGPIARFGDTAANAGILALLESNGFLRKLPKLIQTVFASTAAALFRMILTPVDTVKTTLQAQGQRGWGVLRQRIKVYGFSSLWYGAWATAAATFVGHYPWFGTYNYLRDALPQVPKSDIGLYLLRQAFIGFVASVISDTVSNSLRVIKTYRQVNDTRIGYMASAREVIASDGLRGLFGRGLKTRIIANGLQGILFSVLWRLFQDLWERETK